jgi:hypothetical protein
MPKLTGWPPAALGIVIYCSRAWPSRGVWIVPVSSLIIGVSMHLELALFVVALVMLIAIVLDQTKMTQSRICLSVIHVTQGRKFGPPSRCTDPEPVTVLLTGSNT